MESVSPRVSPEFLIILPRAIRGLARAGGNSAAGDRRQSLLSTLLFDASFPCGKTTAGSPERRVSVRRLRATRANALSARATNSGTLFAPFVFRFAFIDHLTAGRNLFHQQRKSRAVSQESRDCPRLPIASREVGSGRAVRSSFRRVSETSTRVARAPKRCRAPRRSEAAAASRLRGELGSLLVNLSSFPPLTRIPPGPSCLSD